MLKICHVCGKEKEHKSWKSTTCNECLEACFKWCSECCTVQPLSNFHLARGKPQPVCKTCHAKRSARSYTSTGYMKRDDVKQRRKVAKMKYYKTEHGHTKVNQLVRERQRRLYNSSEEYRLNKIAQGHARRAISGTYSAEDFKAICDFFDDKCCYCGAEALLTADHLQALASGGTNDVSNIVPACLSCNCSKGATEYREWFHAQPFFDKERLAHIEFYKEVMQSLWET